MVGTAKYFSIHKQSEEGERGVVCQPGCMFALNIEPFLLIIRIELCPFIPIYTFEDSDEYMILIGLLQSANTGSNWNAIR